MAWIKKVHSLLNQNRIDEALTMIKDKAGDEKCKTKRHYS
jgi:hypothetical protein